MNLHITQSFNKDRLCKKASVLLFLVIVWTLAFKNLVVGWKIDAGCEHNNLVSLATHAIFNEGLQCITVSYLDYTLYIYLNQFTGNLGLNIRECLKNKFL